MLPTKENRLIIHNTIDMSADNGKFNGKKVIIFGCTLYAANILEELKKKNISVYCFIDNDSSKEGHLCSGVIIHKPSILKHLKKDEVVILIASHSYAREMMRQVKSLGFDESSVIEIKVINPNVKYMTAPISAMNEKIKCVKDGVKYYTKLMDEGMDKLFLCPYPGTGDVYLACGFLYEYLKKNNISQYKIVVTKNNCKQVAELFGYNDVVVVSELEMRKMLLAWQFLGDEKIAIKPLLFWGWDTKYYFRNYRMVKSLSFIDFFKYDVFGLDDKAVFYPPKLKRDENKLKLFFEKNGLVKGKTVIIAPYAGSFVSSISKKTWEDIVKYLLEKGYSVCTNCYGEEIPIEGTIPIQFPYSEVVNVLDYAGGFIGVRSGLCDIASSSRCKMVVIYENSYLSCDYEFFSLKKMGLNTSVHEVNYEKENDFLQEIKTLF